MEFQSWEKHSVCDWMVYDWKTPYKMPWLKVASIGGLIRHQGRIPETEWNRLKREALSLQSQDLENSIAAVEKRLRDGANLNYEIMKREITELSASDSNSATIITDLLVESEFGRFDAWCVLKLIYTDRSIAAIYVYVPKEYPDALAVLRGLAQRVSAP